MGSVAYRVPLPKEGSHTFFVAGDFHSKHLNIPTFTKLIQVAQTVPKESRSLIINGDIYDLWYAFAKNEQYKHWKNLKHCAEDFFIPEFDAETKIVIDILEAVQSVFSQVILVGGNHDQPRLDNIIRVTSTPAMCDLNPEYLRNADSNWENGFTILTVTDSVLKYSINNVIVRDSSLVLVDGRVI